MEGFSYVNKELDISTGKWSKILVKNKKDKFTWVKKLNHSY